MSITCVMDSHKSVFETLERRIFILAGGVKWTGTTNLEMGMMTWTLLHKGNSSIQDKSGSEGGIDPLDIANPASAYFFLSDDAQDEISGGKRKNMKCRSCGHRFAGEFYESCPECYSANTKEFISDPDGTGVSGIA